MKQIWPTYAYSPTTNVLTLTGLNIDRDQLLLVTAADRGRIMYNFADSSVTASAFTSGANTALTLVATTAGLTTTAALVIYFDDQATSSTVTGTVELGPTSLNALESITVTMGQVTVTGGLTDVQLRASAVTVGGTVTVGNSLTISSLPAISGTVTANVGTILAKRSDSGAITVGYLPLGDSAYSGQSGAVVVMGGADDGAVPAHLTSIYGLTFPVSGTVTVGNSVTIGSALPAGTNRIGVVTIGGGTVTIGAGTAQIGSVTASISGAVTAGNLPIYNETDTIVDGAVVGSIVFNANGSNAFGVNGVTVGSIPSLPAGTNRIGVVTIGAGTVTIGAGTAQIGSVTASISGTVPISISSVTVGNSVTIGSLPAISGTVTANGGTILVKRIDGGAVTIGYLPIGDSTWSGQSGAVVVMGGADDGAVPVHLTSVAGLSLEQITGSLPISGTVTANTFAVQGTAVTTSNFTSTTASTVLANYNATREVLTIFNEGAGQLFVSVGATCTTAQYQVRLSSGDYYEAPSHQTTITHSAVFATAGTARVTQVS